MGEASRLARTGRPRRTLLAWVEANRPHICWLCDLPINMRADRQRHPLALAVDEIIPVVRGGDPTSKTNTMPSHRCCNGSRGKHAMVPQDPRWLHRTMEPEEVRTRCRTLALTHMPATLRAF